MRLAFLAGNKRDPQDLPGLAGLVASMLTQGTKTRSYQQIAEALDDMGGIMNAASGADAITIEGSVLSENAGKLLTLMSDAARNSTFPENELTLQKQNRKQTLTVQHSQPAFLATEEYRKLLFGDQPYAHVGPTAAAIDKMDQTVLAGFRDSWLVPNNAFLLVVGKFNRADILKAITAEFGAWQQKTVAPFQAPAPPPAKRQLVLVDRPGSVQADVRIGKVGLTFRDPSYFPESVGSIIEGGGPSSRLFDDIREKRGYAYDVHTEVTGLADAGTFSVVTQLRNEIAADGVAAILEHLDRMTKEPVTAQELSDAKAYASGIFVSEHGAAERPGGSPDSDSCPQSAQRLPGYLHHPHRIRRTGSDSGRRQKGHVAQ
jgi:zinc protease